MEKRKSAVKSGLEDAEKQLVEKEAMMQILSDDLFTEFNEAIEQHGFVNSRHRALGGLAERIKEKVDHVNALSKSSCETSNFLLEQGKRFSRSYEAYGEFGGRQHAGEPIKTCFLWQFACPSGCKKLKYEHRGHP